MTEEGAGDDAADARSLGARDDRGRVEVTGGLPEGAVVVARPPKGAADGRRARIADAP